MQPDELHLASSLHHCGIHISLEPTVGTAAQPNLGFEGGLSLLRLCVSGLSVGGCLVGLVCVKVGLSVCMCVVGCE